LLNFKKNTQGDHSVGQSRRKWAN